MGLRAMIRALLEAEQPGDYRMGDKAALSKEFDMIDREIKMAQRHYHNAVKLINEPDIGPHFSMAATNATRALRIAGKIIIMAGVVLREFEVNYQAGFKRENALIDMAIEKFIAIERALESVKFKSRN